MANKNQGIYRTNLGESIDTLKAKIAGLERDKERLLNKRSRNERRAAFFRAAKSIFIRRYGGLRSWFLAVIISSVFGGVGAGIYACNQSEVRKTRRFIRGHNPAPVGCVDPDSSVRAICVLPDTQLIECDSKGCVQLSVQKPEDF